MAAILAIGSAFFWALSYIVSRVGLGRSNTLSAVLITMVSSLFASLVVSLIMIPVELFFNGAILYFIAVGFIGPFVARFLLFEGIDRLGASITSPLVQVKPIFASIAAILILGEKLTFSIALGTFLIILGAAGISSEQSGGQIVKKWSRKDLIFPILAGACIGLAEVFRKMGLNSIPEPLVGVTMQNATALIFFPLFALIQKNRQKLVLNDKKAWLTFGLAGLFIVLGQLCIFCALDLGSVVVVSPLSSMTPLFVLLFVGIFLRKLERVTWKIVLGSGSIVGGLAVLTVLPKV